MPGPRSFVTGEQPLSDSTSRAPCSRVDSSAWARAESRRQSPGRPGGRGPPRTEGPPMRRAKSRRLRPSAPATCSGPATSSDGQLEDRRRQVSDLDGRAQLVVVERHRRIAGELLVARRAVAAVDQGRADRERVRALAQHAAPPRAPSSARSRSPDRERRTRPAGAAGRRRRSRRSTDGSCDPGAQRATTSAPSTVIDSSSWRYAVCTTTSASRSAPRTASSSRTSRRTARRTGSAARTRCRSRPTRPRRPAPPARRPAGPPGR